MKSDDSPGHGPAGSTPHDHTPKISRDRTRIVGCTCGWITPHGTTDSDDAFSEHVAINTTRAGGRQ